MNDQNFNAEPSNLKQRLIGRAIFLHKRGEIKSAEPMEEAASALAEMERPDAAPDYRTAQEYHADAARIQRRRELHGI